MSEGNYDPAFCEDLHSRILKSFHEFRKSKDSNVQIPLDGGDLSRIIGNAKTSLYKQRPEARKAGFKKHEE